MTPEEEKEFDEKFGSEYYFSDGWDGIDLWEIRQHISQLLQQRVVEHCDEPSCPECNLAAYNKGRKDRDKELVEKIKQYKSYHNPIGDERNTGKHIACNAILSLLSNNKNI